MVGVPKSTGCLICRKRKIKCDETWPTCLNCRKNGKTCPGPPARHTFRDSVPKLTVGTPDEIRNVALEPLGPQRQDLTRLNEKLGEDGSVMYQFRLSHQTYAQAPRNYLKQRSSSKTSTHPEVPLLRQPCPSEHQRLAHALIMAITTGSAGQRMSVFGSFIHEVPARIGHNPALDAAVIVLLNVHASLVHKETAQGIVSPILYLRAITALQTCLEHCQLGRSANTLCASVLLGLVEAYAGPRVGNRYIAHVGGAGRLIELHGPRKFSDPFMREMLLFNRGGIIITCMYARKPCFLALPEWREVAFDKSGRNVDACLHTDVMHFMAQLPQIFRDLEELSKSNSCVLPGSCRTHSSQKSDWNEPYVGGVCTQMSPSDEKADVEYLGQLLPAGVQLPTTTPGGSHSSVFSNLLQQIQSFKNSLHVLAGSMNAKLADGSTVTKGPSNGKNNPISIRYHFSNQRDMTAYNCFWSTIIITNKIIMRLLPQSDATVRELHSECRSLAFEICKTWDDTWASRPIGAFHTNLSFVVAYEYCTSEVQEWILEVLNSLLDCQMEGGFRWSRDTISMMLKKLTGESLETAPRRVGGQHGLR
ncbi:hypothetical protein T440DRAFT_472659 [Plenodomus tracheiphilus IPT5]|uniref:Zn(2)-C6 fungal-type domain-containing protein n=1 Tax=Plenodomus tracheiphilus IPT5 TaxID=1408161 RepID=A0A6A7AQT2_9PLEO|nr:hypothetical protein T440DRAFT_472659 [Plenodomus tracheiphilus IPT5]